MLANRTIARRVAWLNVLVSGTALLITAVALLIYDQSSYKRILVENVSAQADVVGRNSVSALLFKDPQSAKDTLGALESVPNIHAASLFQADQSLFASFNRPSEPDIPTLSPQFDLRPNSQFQGNYLYVVRPLRSGDTVAGYLVIRADAS